MSVFREYDIRGVADTNLVDSFCWGLGRALGDLARKAGDTKIYVGQDVRLSSPRISQTLCAGLEASGITPRLLDKGPTPLLYFVTHKNEPDFKTKSGVMVTGSHNPAEYNGFKMVIGGKTLFGDDIQNLRESVLAYQKQFTSLPAKKYPLNDLGHLYIKDITQNISLKKKLKVVVDAGNGAGAPLAVQLYRDLGCEVVELFCDQDGRFPNHHPDPTVPKNLTHLIQKVKETHSDLGIAFDGDADRIGAVSATGQILFGDHLVLYFARDILKEIPNATIISEVKSSQILYDTLAKWGATPIIWKTGHSLIKAKLKETHAALAGEMSGHMFFAHRYYGYDDALYAGARLLEGMSQRNETLDQFLASLPNAINTPEIRLDCPDDVKFGLVERFVSIAKSRFGNDVLDIDGARIKMHGGWGLLRASNTQPVLVFRFEAPSQDQLQLIRQEFINLLSESKAPPEVAQSMTQLL